MRSGPGKMARNQKKKKEKKNTVVSNKKKSTVMSPIRRQMKKRNPSGGQNGQLVHWWLLIHSGQPPWVCYPSMITTPTLGCGDCQSSNPNTFHLGTSIEFGDLDRIRDIWDLDRHSFPSWSPELIPGPPTERHVVDPAVQQLGPVSSRAQYVCGRALSVRGQRVSPSAPTPQNLRDRQT